MLHRPDLIKRLEDSTRRNPVTALLGPRQCGKTTLAHFFCKRRKSAYFDLEDLPTFVRFENPRQNLIGLRGIVVIDEIQRMPELFKTLRVLADRRPLPVRFLILGSASFNLIRRSSESLAGRIGFVEMGGFMLSEIEQRMTDKLWLRGGFPKSFLARSDKDSRGWREDFIRTFLERDIPQLGIRISPLTLRRFWTMVAHYHGRIWNGSEIGGSLGVAHTTVRQYLDILTGTFVIRQLAPWYQNIGKRLVKSPKIYIRDSGLLHSLLRISDRKDLQSHPKLGTSWEGFALEQILSRVNERDCYFWATHAGAELDLLVLRGGRRLGFEFKFSDAPALTKSMKIAKRDLALDHLWVIYPGNVRYVLGEKIDCIGLIDLDVILRKEMKS